MCVILLNIERERKKIQFYYWQIQGKTTNLIESPIIFLSKMINHIWYLVVYLIFKNELFTNENAKNLLYSPFSQLMVLFNPLANQIPQLQKN